MAQFRQIGKSQRRQRSAAPPPASRERGEIAVGKRQHHEIGRILTEVPWRRRLLKAAALAEDDVHQTPSRALMAASSMSPCSPITTSFDCLARTPQGMSN